MMENDLAAPCGVYCGACRQYLLRKQDLENKRGHIRGCKGCRPRNKMCAGIKRDCQALTIKELEFCFECVNFPCYNLTRLDTKYRDKYSTSIINNLLRIQEIGVEKWLKEQQKLYTCNECGGEICVHNAACYVCGMKFNPNKNK